MTNITKGLEALVSKLKEYKEEIAKVINGLSQTEKILIGVVYAIIALCVIFPAIFWIATALAVCYIVGDKLSKKEKEKETTPEIISSN